MLIVKGFEILTLCLLGFLAFRINKLYRNEENERKVSMPAQPVMDASYKEPSDDENAVVVEKPAQTSVEVEKELQRRSEAFKKHLRESSDKARIERKVLLKKSPLQQAEAFFDTQLKEANRDPHHLTLATNSFLIGAIELIGKHYQLDTASRKALIRETFHSKLPGSVADDQDALEQAIELAFTKQVQLSRAGAKAARVWLKTNMHSEELSLKTQLGVWRAFAE